MSPPVHTADFPFLSRNVMRYVILGAMKYLSLSLFDNAFRHCKRSLVVEKIYPKHNFLLKSDNPAIKIFKLFSILEGHGG